MILRAADASEKYDWLARLRHATEPGAGGRARGVGTSSGAVQRGGNQAKESEEKEEKVGGGRWQGKRRVMGSVGRWAWDVQRGA